MLDVMPIHIKMPFSQAEFLRMNKAEQINRLKDLLRVIAKKGNAEPFDLEKKLEEFKEGGLDTLVMCQHEAACALTFIVMEEKLEAMRLSMETLCEEMERTKAEAAKTFIMGPGTDG